MEGICGTAFGTLIFSTKHRRPVIQGEWKERLHEYLGGTILGLGGTPCGIGGVNDHVHILMGLKATHCLSDVMRELKKAATLWVHDELHVADFGWQEGYAAFTVSPTSKPQVNSYIANQVEHHRRRSFRDELKDFLELAGIAYEDKYLD